MNNNIISLNEFKSDIADHLEKISVVRRMAIDMGYSADEIDAYIATEGSRQIKRFSEMSVNELVKFMVEDMIAMGMAAIDD